MRSKLALQPEPAGRWLAVDESGSAGAVTARERPDGRTFLAFACPNAAAYGPLTSAAHEELGSPLFTAVDAGDTAAVAALETAGFTPDLVTDRFRVRFDAALGRMRRATAPAGVTILPVAAVDEDRLFALDNTLRHDVPGTDGWRGNREWFRDELSDPAAYFVAVGGDGEYAGLVRIWRNPDEARFGLIGVLRRYRGTLMGPALLRQGLIAAAEWGRPDFTTDVSPVNARLHRHVVRMGAERIVRSLRLAFHNSA